MSDPEAELEECSILGCPNPATHIRTGSEISSKLCGDCAGPKDSKIRTFENAGGNRHV